MISNKFGECEATLLFRTCRTQLAQTQKIQNDAVKSNKHCQFEFSVVTAEDHHLFRYRIVFSDVTE